MRVLGGIAASAAIASAACVWVHLAANPPVGDCAYTYFTLVTAAEGEPRLAGGGPPTWHFPFYLWLGGRAVAALGEGPAAVRVIGLAALLAAAWTIGAFVARGGSRRAGLLAAAVTLGHPLLLHGALTIDFDALLLPAVCATALWMAQRGAPSGWRPAAALAGLTALAVFLKESAAWLLLASAVGVLAVERPGWRRAWWCAAAMATGIAVGAAAGLALIAGYLPSWWSCLGEKPPVSNITGWWGLPVTLANVVRFARAQLAVVGWWGAGAVAPLAALLALRPLRDRGPVGRLAAVVALQLAAAVWVTPLWAGFPRYFLPAGALALALCFRAAAEATWDRRAVVTAVTVGLAGAGLLLAVDPVNRLGMRANRAELEGGLAGTLAVGGGAVLAMVLAGGLAGWAARRGAAVAAAVLALQPVGGLVSLRHEGSDYAYGIRGTREAIRFLKERRGPGAGAFGCSAVVLATPGVEPELAWQRGTLEEGCLQAIRDPATCALVVGFPYAPWEIRACLDPDGRLAAAVREWEAARIDDYWIWWRHVRAP